MSLILENLTGLLAALFGVKDLFAFRYFANKEFSFERDFIARMVMLPGSLLFWGFGAWLVPFLNVFFGALAGWAISKIIASRRLNRA